MPCDIGIRSYDRIEIPAPVPQDFAEKSAAPGIDADLLEKLGIDDPVFLKWVSELNTRPLLEEALKRALAKVPTGGLVFALDESGMLEAKGRFTSASEKNRLSAAAKAVSDRWQFELLGIVAELLDYTVTITVNGETMVLEAEEAGKTHPCDYIRVSRRGDQTEITFEHFKSERALDVATAKFFALANKLGVKLALNRREVITGDPFPATVEHSHSHAHGHIHGHRHEH